MLRLPPSRELEAIFLETLRRLDPAARVRAHLQGMELASDELTILALGKAAVPMAEAACQFLGSRVAQTLVVAPTIPQGKGPQWLASSHPIPDESSERAGRALLAAARAARGEVLVLISGGGSALAAVPVPGLSLRDKAELCTQLAAAGAPIGELNAVRKQLSAIKGGGLAMATTVPVHSLYVSDVVGDDLGTIASGPTLLDASSRVEALEIVRRYLGAEYANPATSYLIKHAGDRRPDPAPTRRADTHVLLAGVDTLAAEAHKLAQERGHRSQRLSCFSGPIAPVALDILAALDGVGVAVGGGEAILRLPANVGQGGRAQHLAMLMAQQIRGRGDIEILVAGSDGIDGNSAAAGALVDGQTIARMMELGIDPERVVAECNVGPALAALGAQIITGPTGVNHADIVLVLTR